MASSSCCDKKPIIKCCLFDMDGLLINTEDVYTLSTTMLLKEYNRPAMTWDFKTQVMGLPGSEVYKKFVKYYHLENELTEEEYAQKQHDFQEKLWKECVFLPGVEEMLNRLFKMGIPMGICTSSNKKKFDLKIVNSLSKLIEKFDVVILGDDPRLKNGLGKPHPRIYQLGLEGVNAKNKKNILPSETLVFEDALLGCKAGKSFGGTVCWIPHTELYGKLPELETEFEHEGQGFVLQSMDKFPFDKYDFQSIKKD
ncbi:hypothetical protein ACO0SA_004763 [Hanseniaspora valbyensis]